MKQRVPIIQHLFHFLILIQINLRPILALNVKPIHNNEPSYCTKSRRYLSPSTNKLESNKNPVQIWDNTLPTETLAFLHEQASQRGLGHNIFKRSQTKSAINNKSKKSESIAYLDNLSLTPIEQVLDELLNQLNDTSPIVEYWSRQEWKHIEAHADIDELLVREQQKKNEKLTFRYPQNGHVLYLQVGSSVRGPTCLFPTCRSGGDLLRSQNTNDNSNTIKEDDNDIIIPLITVPAVPSRLLRFHGSLLHTVPRPTDLWFRKFVVGTGETEPFEEWGRSVILFNTWNSNYNDDDDESAVGPHDVFPVHNECNTNNSNDCKADQNLDKISVNQKEKWRETPVHSMNTFHSDQNVMEKASHLDDELMNTKSLEVQKGVANESDDLEMTFDASAKIWLLGDYSRRNCTGRTIKLLASESQLRYALDDDSIAFETFLKKNQ